MPVKSRNLGAWRPTEANLLEIRQVLQRMFASGGGGSGGAANAYIAKIKSSEGNGKYLVTKQTVSGSPGAKADALVFADIAGVSTVEAWNLHELARGFDNPLDDKDEDVVLVIEILIGISVFRFFYAVTGVSDAHDLVTSACFDDLTCTLNFNTRAFEFDHGVLIGIGDETGIC